MQSIYHKITFPDDMHMALCLTKHRKLRDFLQTCIDIVDMRFHNLTECPNSWCVFQMKFKYNIWLISV